MIALCHCFLVVEASPSLKFRLSSRTERLGGKFYSLSNSKLATFSDFVGWLDARRAACRLGFLSDQPQRHRFVRAAGGGPAAYRRLAAAAGDRKEGRRTGAAQGREPVLQQANDLCGRHRPVARGRLLGD